MARALVVGFFFIIVLYIFKKKSNLFTTIMKFLAKKTVQIHVDILNEVKQEHIFIWKGQGRYFG